MATFPKLRTGAVAQYPSSRVIGNSVTVLRYLDGTEQRFRNLAKPARRWVIRLHDVETEELLAIETFFLQEQGQFGSFAFTDPWDGREYPDCSFENDAFELEGFAEGRSAATIVIRNNEA